MTEQHWSKVDLTKDMIDYVYAKYGKNWKEINEVSNKLLDDLYNYAMLKGKYVSMIESSKATYKDYRKLLVTDEMLEYVFAKYANKWNLEDEIAYGKGKVHDLKNRIEKLEVYKEAEHVQLKIYGWNMGKAILDAKGKGKVHDLDLENIIEKLEVDFGRMIKAKEAEHDQLPVNKDAKGKGKVHDLDHENKTEKLEVDFGMMLKEKEAKHAQHDQLKVNKERPQRSRAPTRQVASTSTSNAQAASTSALIGYWKIAMIGCVLGLRAPNDPNAPTSAPRKMKSKNP
ncbi:hypothetical protein Tco_0375210 [Tanacetum coccineum]